MQDLPSMLNESREMEDKVMYETNKNKDLHDI